MPRLFICLAITLATLTLAVPQSQGKKKNPGITGMVRFKGKPPVRKALDTSTDKACTKSLLSEEIVVGEKRALRDVHVRIKSGTAGKHPTPSKPVTISQSGCLYQPHVIGAMVGQPVAIGNSDPTMHNVHAFIGPDTWFNRSQPAGAADIVETDTGEAGEVFELRCDVHPWMHSFVPISDHPYFDVSGNNGRFSIPKVPDGTYTLEAWHPSLGLKSTRIKVVGGSARADFSFP